jgi:hypothetical protein
MSNTNNSLWSQEYICGKLGNYMEKYQKNLRNGQKKSAAAGKLLENCWKKLEKAGKSWKTAENRQTINGLNIKYK